MQFLKEKKLGDWKKQIAILSGFIFFFPLFSFSQNQPFLKLSVQDYPDFTRAVISSSSPLSFSFEKGPSLLMVKIETSISFLIEKEAFESRLIKSFGWTISASSCILAIKTWQSDFNYRYFANLNPPQLVIDFSLQKEGFSKIEDGPIQKTAENKINLSSKAQAVSTAQNSSSHGIKTIVIDPGHGGVEPGAKGKFGALEKNITLAVSLKLKAIIERYLALRVILTREEDVDISLENRAALANNNKADLFISIHANSSYRRDASGSETFFLSMEATDEEARKLAYLENNPAQLEKGISGENEDEIKMILWDMAQTAYLNESSILAESIQNELNSLFLTRNRGIKQAPFKVLTGVACPAVLVEMAFISDPDEERKLKNEDFQQRIAYAIFQGLQNYIALCSQEGRR
jgi:N-acetylmuramoyl-L-alanine amidase